jgi:hypothetical protein
MRIYFSRLKGKSVDLSDCQFAISACGSSSNPHALQDLVQTGESA